MAKQRNQNRVGTGQKVIVRTDRAPSMNAIKFGDVTIMGGRNVHPDIIERNIELGTEALERAVKGLSRPGVVLRAKKDVPRYSIAEDDPRVFIRKLNGRTERGQLVAGVFKVLKVSD